MELLTTGAWECVLKLLHVASRVPHTRMDGVPANSLGIHVGAARLGMGLDERRHTNIGWMQSTVVNLLPGALRTIPFLISVSSQYTCLLLPFPLKMSPQTGVKADAS